MERPVDREELHGTGRSSSGDSRRKDIPSRDRGYRLSGDEMKTLRTVSTFRTMGARDLSPATKLKNLIEAGLVEKHEVYVPKQKGAKANRLEVLTVSDAGLEVLESMRPADDLQRLYSGLVKKNELAHDAAIYPAYLEQAALIEKAGGQVKRVVLDYEFKSIVNGEMNKKKGPPADIRREQLAKDLDLEIVGGKLPLPDLRIEYVDEHGMEQHRDVEVTTAHYRGSHMAGKARSGFALVSASKVGVVRDRQGGTPPDESERRLF